MDANIQPYVPVDCNLYDYLEIACLHSYEVELCLHDESIVTGRAKTTRIKDGCEFLVVKDKHESRSIRLDLISNLRVLSSPRQFDSVSFSSK